MSENGSSGLRVEPRNVATLGLGFMSESESRHLRVEPTGDIIGSNGDGEVGPDAAATLSREGSFDKLNDMEEERTSSERMNAKYPSDCYSFLSIHGPFENPKFFAFGVMVWAFQITFHILMVLRVAGGTKLSENEDIDNPDNGFWSNFIPSNVSTLSRVTQFMALISYCVFADESLKDIVKAVETFPNFAKVREADKPRCMMFACILRFSQGILATVVVLLLVVNTNDVIDIILNFTAVNFISAFDEIAFELAQWGKYGPDFKAEAKRIEDLTVPDCIFRKYDHVRYVYTVLPVAITLMILISSVAIGQSSDNVWLTQRFRVQFLDGSLFEGYSGCYSLDRNFSSWSRKREDYASFEANAQTARFGYCANNRKWYLYQGDGGDACEINETQKIAYSSKTYSFDISTTFEELWYSSGGKPLQLYFFDDDVDLNDGQCSAFVGDGTCDPEFNKADYDYDEGDCCAPTCTESICGVGELKEVFETEIASGNGYRTCYNPSLKPITILLNDVYVPKSFAVFETNGAVSPKEPSMIIDCDGQNIIMVSIKKEMAKKAETIMVADGANCIMKIKNTTIGDGSEIYFVDYTIFHGDSNSIDNDPIVMAQGDSYENSVIYFQRTKDCFLRKLGDHINISTMYTGTDPSNEAIRWLMKDSKGNSNCERNEFLERYALTVINFAAPMNAGNASRSDIASNTDRKHLWITTGRHCLWRAVGCTASIVTELNYAALGKSDVYGTIATEIGLLKNLTDFTMSSCNLHGSIPSQIGQLTELTSLSIQKNNLSGSISTEIGVLSNLITLLMYQNLISGSIPSEIQEMTSLETFGLYDNALTGSIPSEIGKLSNTFIFELDSNFLTGTLPTEIGNFNNIIYFGAANNSFTGTIPSELGKSESIENIHLELNNLVGSVPSELLYLESIKTINLYGNKLSDLIPLNDTVVCTESGGEHYCDCKNQCVTDPYTPNHCGCQEAQECCTSFLEQYEVCSICEEGFENPNMFIPGIRATCDELSVAVARDTLSFGNIEDCRGVANFAENAGCGCKGIRDCNICYSDFENPDFVVEEYNATCSVLQSVVSQNLGYYTGSGCFLVRQDYIRKGCKCKNPEEEPSLEDQLSFASGGNFTFEEEQLLTAEEEPTFAEEYTECVVCEFGIENPEFFLEEFQASCNDAILFVKEDIEQYGTTSGCQSAALVLTELGCKCEEGDQSDLMEQEADGGTPTSNGGRRS